MDPPIEDIAAKWASIAIVHNIQRSEEQFEQTQIKFQLERAALPAEQCRYFEIELGIIVVVHWERLPRFL